MEKPNRRNLFDDDSDEEEDYMPGGGGLEEIPVTRAPSTAVVDLKNND
jgi:hypothetical protein